MPFFPNLEPGQATPFRRPAPPEPEADSLPPEIILDSLTFTVVAIDGQVHINDVPLHINDVPVVIEAEE